MTDDLDEPTEDGDLKFLGYSNDWSEPPIEVSGCTHEREAEKEGPFLRRISCLDCGFWYMEESS